MYENSLNSSFRGEAAEIFAFRGSAAEKFFLPAAPPRKIQDFSISIFNFPVFFSLKNTLPEGGGVPQGTPPLDRGGHPNPPSLTDSPAQGFPVPTAKPT